MATTRRVSKKLSDSQENRQERQLAGKSTRKKLISYSSSSVSYITKLSIVILLLAVSLVYVYHRHQDWQWHSLEATVEAVKKITDRWFAVYWNDSRSLFGTKNAIQVDNVLRGLLRLESSIAVRRNASIALGFGACTDLVVDSLKVG